MRQISSLDELQSLLNQPIAVSDWKTMTQKEIDDFAQLTGDTQWIHIDAERCRRDSPFGTTVAHGLLTLSLIPAMMAAAIELPPGGLSVNYGLNKVRFPAPVPSGSRVRSHIALASIEPVTGGMQIIWNVTVEREGSDKPVCVAELVTRRYG